MVFRSLSWRSCCLRTFMMSRAPSAEAHTGGGGGHGASHPVTRLCFVACQGLLAAAHVQVRPVCRQPPPRRRAGRKGAACPATHRPSFASWLRALRHLQPGLRLAAAPPAPAPAPPPRSVARCLHPACQTGSPAAPAPQGQPGSAFLAQRRAAVCMEHDACAGRPTPPCPPLPSTAPCSCRC